MAVLSRVARPRNVALAAVLAANGALAQNPTCLNFQGFTDDGSTVAGDFVQVSSGGTDTFTAGFTPDVTAATIFNLDAATGILSDVTDTTNGAPRIANIDAGFTFDYIFFDNATVIEQFTNSPLDCATDANGVLSCFPVGDNTVATINYCEGVLAIGQTVRDDFGCQGITLVAAEVDCPPAVPVTTTTATSTSTTTAGATTTSASTDLGISTSTESTTTTTTATTTGASTDAGVSTSTTTSASTDAPVMTTSTVFSTSTVTVTSGDATTVTTSVYPAYTTVCPVGAGEGGYYAAPTGGYAAPGSGSYYGSGGDNSGAPYYGDSGAPAYGTPAYGAAPTAPNYNPAHLAALPTSVCSEQLNAVATKYPAGAMDSYAPYGYTPSGDSSSYNNGGNNNNGGSGSYSNNNGGNGNYAGNNGGNGNYAGNNAAGYSGNHAGGDYSGSYNGAAANNGSAGGYNGGYSNGNGAGAASGTGSWSAYPTTPMQYEGSASSVKMALGGVFAAAIALVCLI